MWIWVDAFSAGIEPGITRFLKCRALHHWAKVTDESRKILWDPLILVKKSLLGYEMTKCSNYLLWSLLGLAVIHKYKGEGAILTRKCHTWKDCCYKWSELISDNGEIDPLSGPYQPDAFGLSQRPGLGFFFGLCTKKPCFFLFSFASILSTRWFLVFGLLCRHTASDSSTAETHTSGAQ